MIKMKSHRLLCILFSLSILVHLALTECQNQWITVGKSCYYFQNVTATFPGHTWDDSRLICQQYGADLIKIDNDAEFKFITKYFSSLSVKYNHYWIGLNDKRNEGKWEWADQTALNDSAKNWRTTAGEPNNWQNEDCAEMTWDGQWNDNKCDRIFGYVCERSADSTLPTTPTLPSIPPNNTDKPTTCEAGWVPWGSSCYGIIRGIYKTWWEARNDCKRRFADLLIIEDQKEQDFLANELGSADAEYWIGLSDTYSEGKFYWVDRTELNTSFTNWRPSQPSNDFGNEDCVEMYGKWMPGKWNDNHCTSLKNYICEKAGGVHNCPYGWVTYKGNCYQINGHPSQQLNWSEARQKCLDFNRKWRGEINVAQADLVSIKSQEEQTMLINEFSKIGRKDATITFWTGLTDTNSTGNYYWTDGSILKYNNWKSLTALTDRHCVKSNLDTTKRNWVKEMCKEKMNFVCKVARGQDRCYNPLGIQSHRIPNNAMTSSGSLTPSTSAPAGRLYMQANAYLGGAWCADNSSNPWLQIDFGKREKLTYMSMQGKSDSDAFVLAFYLKYSIDGISWDTYGDVPPARYFKFKNYLSWRTTREKVMNLPLPSPLVARYIRIYPLESHLQKCMRVEFYGCEDEVENQRCGLYWQEDKATKNCYRFTLRKTTWDSANELCGTQGSELLSIASNDELTFIKDQVLVYAKETTDFWIGLNDLEAEGFRKWSDSSPLGITNWYKENPQVGNKSANCGSMRTEDGYWVDNDCTTFRSYICKRAYQSPYVPKDPFNNNWISKTDYYWPLNAIPTGNMVEGTLPIKPTGTFSIIKFPIHYSANSDRYTLQFSGKDNTYLTIPGLDECVSHPDSNSCPHGITVSFVFKYKQVLSTFDKVVLDTINSQDSSVGYRVYVNMGKMFVLLRGQERYYKAGGRFNSGAYHHLAFTWSKTEGLKVYIDGILSSSHLYGSSNSLILNNKNSNELYVGKSASTKESTAFFISSLAIFERVIKDTEVQQIFLAEFGECYSHQLAHGSYCYEFNTTHVDWKTAQQTCRNNKGDLLSIHSPVEQALLNLNSGALGYDLPTWIGLNQKGLKNNFNWSDGSSVYFSYWNKNEPNNWRGRREDCVMTWVHPKYGKNKVFGDDGFWNDELCYLRRPFACKYERVKMMMGASETRDTEYEYNVPSYGTRTIGCPFDRAISVVSAKFGNLADKCSIDGKAFVEKACSGSMCRGVRATKSFFNGTDPCPKKRYARKTITIKYKCADIIQDRPDPSYCNSPTVQGYSVLDDSGTCYKLYRTSMSFTDALSTCKKDKGVLAIVNNRDIQMHLTSLMNSMFERKDLWIGMKYNDSTNIYSWIDGTPVEYTNWGNKQPDPRNGGYIKVSLQESAKDFLFWKPAHMNESLPFFCQKKKPNLKPKNKTTTPAPSGDCPTGWFKHNQHCYFVNNKTLSYTAAQAECQRFATNSYLASILSFDENEKVFNDFINKTVMFAWLGLSNEAITSGFRWEDGSPLTFVNWFTDRPYTGNKHLCAGMSSGGKWWDLPCYSKYPSLCKAPLGMKPATTNMPIAGPTTTQDPSLCKFKDWIHYNGSCYFFTNSSVSVDYYEARSTCAKMGANLATVSYSQENDFIYSQLRRKYVFSAYIGLSDLSSEGNWKWVDGSVVNYMNFRDPEPNNFNGMEDCTEIRSLGYWADIACNMKKGFVCKQTNGTAVTYPNTTAPPDTGFCDSGWLLYGSKCYLLVYGKGNRKDFKGAREYCQQYEGAELASIHKNYENAFLLSQLYDANEPVFIGLSDQISERKFVWTDQSPVDYVNWNIRQPSRYGNEDCVEMLPYFKQRGQWNDINCNYDHGFICQAAHSLTPPPTTPAPSNPCPKGFLKYRESCYMFHQKAMTFNDSRTECQKFENGDLVSLHDSHEQAFVFSHFIQHGLHSWIGLRKTDKPAWTDNTPYDYNYWLTFVYSKFFYAQYESCATQEFSNRVDGKWKYQNCSAKFPSVCKISREFDKTKTSSSFIGNCTEGWTKINDKCYRVYKEYSEKAYWAAARERCKGQGGDLATIQDKDTQQKLQYMIRDLFVPVWIGLNDRNKEYAFEWSSGIPLLPDSFENWASNEPSDVIGSENCVEISPSDGRWNDLSCYRSKPYICEHPLECREALGMEDKTIPDANINATSYLGDYYPKHARINAKFNNLDTAWCTNITTKKESLTIDLGELMTITRITTQGLYNIFRDKRSWVISYMLEYSTDGRQWMKYVDTTTDLDNTVARPMPGNSDSKKIEGTIVNIKATFLRFIPQLYKGNKICMKVELYGCKSSCKRALGMGSLAITDDQLSATSTLTSVSKARPNNNNEYWCAKEINNLQYYQIDLKRPTKLTRIMVAATTAVYYELLLSDNGKDYRKYRTVTNTERVFNTLQTTYDLDVVQATRYIRFYVVRWSENAICLQVEIYGCLYKCESALGMQAGIIPDSVITSSSHSTNHGPTKARLSAGAYNMNSWCAGVDDKSQYLQIDFTQEAHINQIAVQGFDGDNAKYVSKYNVQWSNDNDFWHTTPSMKGNTNGYSIETRKLSTPIIARYVRINPSEWKNGICMRIEFYGCPLSSIKEPVKPEKHNQDGSLRLTSVEYTDALSVPKSEEFISLANKVRQEITDIYLGVETFKDGFDSVTVNSFKPGSVIVAFTIYTVSMNSNEDVTAPLKDAVKTGKVGQFTVDKEYEIFKTKGSTGKSTSESGGLSNAGKIGLVVFFLLLLCIVLVVGGIYYFRSRGHGFRLQFAHKSFENPIHDDENDQDEMKVEFMNSND